MRDNLVFSGIPESAEEDPEATVKTFIKTYLKLPEDTVENICFERVHRMGAKKPGAPRPRPIVAKFGYFKQKEQVKSRGRELKGTDFGVNDQFPKEILERRKILFPIRRSLIQKGSRAVIAVDRLYVDEAGQNSFWQMRALRQFQPKTRSAHLRVKHLPKLELFFAP